MTKEILTNHLKQESRPLVLNPNVEALMVEHVADEAMSWRSTSYRTGSTLEAKYSTTYKTEKTEQSQIRQTTDYSRYTKEKTIEENVIGCLHYRQFLTQECQLNSTSTESLNYQFLVTHEKNSSFNGTVERHRIPLHIRTILDEMRYHKSVEFVFPDNFNMTQATCQDAVQSVLSQLQIPSFIINYLPDHLSNQALLWSSHKSHGISCKIQIKENFERFFDISCLGTAQYPCLSQMQDTDLAEKVCTICQEEVAGDGRSLLELTCTHTFHWNCITTWLKEHNNCPTCRENVGDEAVLC